MYAPLTRLLYYFYYSYCCQLQICDFWSWSDFSLVLESLLLVASIDGFKDSDFSSQPSKKAKQMYFETIFFTALDLHCWDDSDFQFTRKRQKTLLVPSSTQCVCSWTCFPGCTASRFIFRLGNLTANACQPKRIGNMAFTHVAKKARIMDVRERAL